MALPMLMRLSTRLSRTHQENRNQLDMVELRVKKVSFCRIWLRVSESYVNKV